ncbi:NUDIX domain-containing protein [Sphingomonas sp. 4RDLI-65]|uniref:NUDIX hydrolase n=1 Tax=Sphingomonas sp. 4RDLI-65 TaxID=3111641 RepID=UPI003C22D0AF
MTDVLPPAIPAATLVIFRDTPAGPPELLMVERAKAMAFAGGALVFPGGRVDPGDHALAALLGSPDHETAARIAAIRETIEEAGLPVGLSPIPSPDAFERLRAALHTGAAFGEALAEAGTSLALDALEYFARWRPAHAHARIFDTRFYLARLPADMPADVPEARVDATENVRLLWATAADVLAEADAGRATIIFPTRRNLERLAQFADHASAVAHARAFPIRTVTPWSERRDGVEYLCIPDDLGYPVTAEPMSDAVRG